VSRRLVALLLRDPESRGSEALAHHHESQTRREQNSFSKVWPNL
jgi:hypothetical protein